MKVRELIEKLQEFDGDLEVYSFDWDVERHQSFDEVNDAVRMVFNWVDGIDVETKIVELI